MIFLIITWKKLHPKKFFSQKKNWESLSFSDVSKRINKIISFLLKQKTKKGDRFFLLSNNRIEWVEFDLAIMMTGGITVPSFVTNNKTDNEHIIKDCKPKFIILENEDVYKKNKSFLGKHNNRIILIEPSKKFINYQKIILKNQKKLMELKSIKMIFLQ